MSQQELIMGLKKTLDQCDWISSQYQSYYDKTRVEGSTIGAHMRHIIEHYEELFAGLDHGIINYEARKRDADLEKDPAIALIRIEGIRGKIDRLDKLMLKRPITLKESICETCDQIEHVSSISRELSFLNLHTVHHLAIIREILRSFDVQLDENFGVAPATVKSRASA